MNKKIISGFLALGMFAGVIPSNIVLAENEISEVSTQAELKKMTDGGSYILTQDIALSDDWNSIYFEGNFDGNGHTITLNGKPLFDSIPKSSEVKNVVLEGEVTGNNSNLGALATNVTGTVKNCADYAAVTYTGTGTTYAIGGIAGGLNKGVIENCFADVTVNYGNALAYGIIANIPSAQSGTITNCFGKGLDRIGTKADMDWSTFDDVYLPITDGNNTILDESYDSEQTAEKLNSNVSDGYLKWSVKDGVLGPWGESDSDGTIKISEASELPQTIESGKSYELTADITLGENQQMTDIAGVLDGKGHKITLNGKSLANKISGTVQNLGLDGNVSDSEEYFGSMAITLTGTIQNCYSTADISAGDNFLSEPSGFVGTLTGGKILNSYFAGKMSGLICDGLVGQNNSADSVIKNSLYTTGTIIGMVNPQIDTSTCEKVSETELKSGDKLEILNRDIVDTGFRWSMPTEGNGFPILKEASGEIDKSALESALNSANEFNKDDYYAGWDAFEEAKANAETVFADDSASQSEVNEALKALNAAISALKKNRTTAAVEIPQDAKHITTVDDLRKINQGEYYVLDNDITISEDDYYFAQECAGVFDGQGHSVNFNSVGLCGLFSSITDTGIVQNVHFTGQLSGYNNLGAAASTLYGSIINCYTDVKGDKACGFAARILGEGVISNSYSVSEGKSGVLVNSCSSNSGEVWDGFIKNTYWINTQDNSVIAEDKRQNSYSMEEAAMKTVDFANELNKNKGDYGVSWGQNGTTGYPYFGENQDYNPGKVELPENKYNVLFKAYNNDEPVEVINQKLHVSPDEVQAVGKIAGNFSLEGVPEDSWIEWGYYSDAKPEGCMLIGSANGDLGVYTNGSVIVKASEIKADGTIEDVAFVQIISQAGEITAIKLYIDNTDVTNGEFTVAGSENKSIRVMAQYGEDGDYTAVASNRFKYTVSDGSLIESLSETSPSFEFKKPGTGTITVSHINNSDVKAEVKVTSSFVAVESVEPDISGERIIHGRNANSTGEKEFNPEYNTVKVTPENASNKNNFTIESSDPTVAEYVPSMVIGYVAHKAGTVTYTAKIDDTDGNGYSKTVTGSTTVTYKYKNPLISVTADNTKLTVKAAENTPLDLNFKGELSDEGYSVTEPELNWTFSNDGIAKIERKNAYGWKRDESAPDNNQWLPLTQYVLYGLRKGTVTATGTPVDRTNNVFPIELEITVESSDAEIPDWLKLANEGIELAQSNLEKDSYEYNNEWLVYSKIKNGGQLTEKQRTDYINSVSETVSAWNESQKPTDIERVVLALSALNADITNIGGKNLAAMIYNHPDLTSGSNELIYALMALDESKTEIPSDAKWSRESMIEELLKFQTDSGSFGLNIGSGVSVDTTAMALQALAVYKDNEKVSAAINSALDYLKKCAGAEYDFGSPEADAQVLMALTALDINPVDADGLGTEYSNTISAILAYKTEYGFAHTIGGSTNNMATVQAMQGLIAYKNYCNKQKPTETPSVTATAEPTETPTATATAEPTGTPSATATAEPTGTPSTTAEPTGTPSATSEPTGTPSATETAEPTETPSATETAEPTATPEVTLKPTNTPSSGGNGGGGSSNIKVKFRLIGSTIADSDVDLSKGESGYNGAEYQTWIKTTTYTLTTNSTVYSLFTKALDDAGLKSSGASDNYVSSINAPTAYKGYRLSEFTNGKYSGWMFTVNGRHPDVGLMDYKLKDGDSVVWHYVNDYRYEGEATGKYYNSWLKAKDTNPSSSSSSSGSSGGGSSRPSVTAAPTVEPTVSPETTEEPSVTLKPDKNNDENKWFKDVSDKAWYYDAVKYSSDKGFMTGIEEQTFAPESKLTRAMFVTVLYRIANKPSAGDVKFSDVLNGSWYADAAAWASENGIVNGVTETEFAPNANITREQMAAMLYRYAMLKGQTSEEANDVQYSDKEMISEYALNAVSWADEADIMNGDEDGSFRPKEYASRAEAAAVFMRMASIVE